GNRRGGAVPGVCRQLRPVPRVRPRGAGRARRDGGRPRLPAGGRGVLPRRVIWQRGGDARRPGRAGVPRRPPAAVGAGPVVRPADPPPPVRHRRRAATGPGGRPLLSGGEVRPCRFLRRTVGRVRVGGVPGEAGGGVAGPITRGLGRVGQPDRGTT